MAKWRSLLKSGIALYSELLWIYFGVALFAKIQWDIVRLPEPRWLITAVIAGCAIGFFSVRFLRPQFIYPSYALSVIAILTMVIRDLPNDSVAYSVLFCLAALFLFARGILFAQREPDRARMLLRFEGNILFYLIFNVIMIVHPIVPETFHTLFAAAIMVSLFGMVLTLNNSDEPEAAGEQMKTQVVGHASWFPLLSVIFISVVLLCSFLLFLPPVRSALTLSTLTGWEALKWIFSLGAMFFQWFLQLFPTPESTGMLPNLKSPDINAPEGGMGDSFTDSYLWVFIILSVLLVGILLWWLSQLALKNSATGSLNVPFRRNKLDYSLWRKFLEWFRHYVCKQLARWKRQFPAFYSLRLFWYYYKFSQWAEGHGFSRFPSESANEYVKRIADDFHFKNGQEFTDANESYQVKYEMIRLGESFSSVYYGKEKVERADNFSALIRFLKSNY